MSDSVDAFYQHHAAGGATHIVVAHAMRKDGAQDIGIFSTLALARAWSDGLDDERYHGCVFAPYVIDVPEFGNVPKEAQQ